jgi:putative zinc finger/helix-turn-helix YgiT family protein
MKKRKGRYHYEESGLPNLYLEGIDIYYCSCGEEMGAIPCIDKLHNIIMRTIVDTSPRLSGREIRFIRKNLELKASEFANLLGVSKVTVSRWENDKVKIDKSYDNMIRALVKSEDFRSVLESINNKDKGRSKSHKYVLDPNELLSRSA